MSLYDVVTFTRLTEENRRFKEALEAAAQSLETCSRWPLAHGEDVKIGFYDVREYASSRAGVARESLAAERVSGSPPHDEARRLQELRHAALREPCMNVGKHGNASCRDFFPGPDAWCFPCRLRGVLKAPEGQESP